MVAAGPYPVDLDAGSSYPPISMSAGCPVAATQAVPQRTAAALGGAEQPLQQQIAVGYCHGFGGAQGAAAAPRLGGACGTNAAGGHAPVFGAALTAGAPAVQTSPGAAAVMLAEMGAELRAANDVRGAVAKYCEALRLNPDLYVARLSLGQLCLEAGDVQGAQEHMERAYRLEPNSADAIGGLGAVFSARGDLDTAVQWYRAAANLRLDCQATQSNLVTTLVSLGLQVQAQDHKRAIKLYQEALVYCPTNSNAYYNLAALYAEQRKHQKALMNYNLAVHFNPHCAEAYNNMGVIYKEQDNLERALRCYYAALQCNPRFTQTLNNLGVLLATAGRLQEALHYLTRAVEVAPNYAEAFNNLGWLFWDRGDLAQALRMYEKCIELSPTAKNPGQNRLLALNYLPDMPPNLVYEAHRAWGERFCREVGAPFDTWPWLNPSADAERRLRIAFISPDFFHHSVSFFIHCVLDHRTPELFDVFLYSNGAREDDKTELFKQSVGEARWRKVLGVGAHEVAKMLRDDCIDILVDLAGHTANNRLDVMALKPAPLQFTWIGYNNSTGLGAIDYRITDGVVDPVNTEQEFVEELVRIPGCFLCYTPPAVIPDVGPLPAFRNGSVTFGSFSCLAKISAPCVALWARVLNETPGSRLLVKNKGFYAREVQVHFTNLMRAHGIHENRLKLLALAPTSFDHLNIYNEVDIALDTFPYVNTTTTCETLLMGVPVVTLTGNTHGHRVGETLCKTVGLPESVAKTQDEYVQKACSLASDLVKLSALRQGLRQRLLASPLCDGPGFVKGKVEPLFRAKWRLLCEGRPPSVQHFKSAEPPHPLAPGHFGMMPRVAAPPQGTSPAPLVNLPPTLDSQGSLPFPGTAGVTSHSAATMVHGASRLQANVAPIQLAGTVEAAGEAKDAAGGAGVGYSSPQAPCGVLPVLPLAAAANGGSGGCVADAGTWRQTDAQTQLFQGQFHVSSGRGFFVHGGMPSDWNRVRPVMHPMCIRA
eukprot:TRINITY_DN29655_c0_g1_i1.p1 TRINITY_DN29655_c0_g1~~TRINITY_DN29655_c0_g1_i1.p1  ORF type:complete len:1011 (+),score=223.22 TRINITY_DN29655_c0_g1_i1:62-3034(+)